MGYRHGLKSLNGLMSFAAAGRAPEFVPYLSEKSVSQWHKVDFVLLTADTTAYNTFRNVEQSVLVAFRKQEMGFRG